MLKRLLFVLIMFSLLPKLYAQTEDEFSSALDSARNAEDNKKDSVIFTAKYVRYTNLATMKKGTKTYQIDTSHVNFQYYNKQNLPWDPSINLGSYGLATRDLLFNPNKTIGFQSGYHALERYLLTSDSIQYYRARARYSELYAVGFFFDDQVFRAKLAQNINPHLNIGAEYHATNTDGYYNNQEYSDRKGAVFAWYESPNKRYNLLTNFNFNTLDATENGSVLNDTLFRDTSSNKSPASYPVRLDGQQANRPFNKWKDMGFFVRQSYYLGRIDTVSGNGPDAEIRPTNVIAHNTRLRQQKYIFFKNQADIANAFPMNNLVRTDDTTKISTISNDFTYSFYLRGKTLKNEAKVELGFQNDLIWYADSAMSKFFQNSMVKGAIGYKFSDKVDVNAMANQIVVGRNFGDFLYEAYADIHINDIVGKLRIGAYTQNKSPEMIFQNANLSYHSWNEDSFDLEKTKTQNLNFQYANDKIGFSGKLEYFLINNYTYFKEVDNPDNSFLLNKMIEPAQAGNLNLLKLTVTQNFKFRRFHLDNRVVYQKSDAMDILATPELYTWHSLYYANKLYNVMDFRIGTDVRFNTPFRTPSYAINAGQFYNDNLGLEFSTYPVVDFWLTGNIDRVNLFLSYNFANQHISPRGYYTVRRYPMNPAFLRFGVSWKFYD
ncbi:Putative porin [Sphingobacterium lactis]|uniref:Putative porin n=2 Tax=Sphingobacterium lactis TaxID=797291 RepID=A0A1H5SRM9_9SPHI|nr:putative porin [Sphingobacterium lactis]SEF52638.1 Putative porin [Sphingobacterium lactis]